MIKRIWPAVVFIFTGKLTKEYRGSEQLPWVMEDHAAQALNALEIKDLDQVKYALKTILGELYRKYRSTFPHKDSSKYIREAVDLDEARLRDSGRRFQNTRHPH